MEDNKPMYSVDAAFPVGTISEIPSGTSLLISGPPMVGKQALAIDVLAAGHRAGDGIMVITTGGRTTDVIDDLDRRVETLDREHIGVIDCSGSDGQRAIADVATHRVSSPSDLTGISIGTAKLFEHFSTYDISNVRHGLISVSTLLQYLEVETVFKFLHVYTRRISETDGLGVFTLDSGSHDAQTVNTIKGEFDGLIELRETDDGEREGRIRGFTTASTGWQRF